MMPKGCLFDMDGILLDTERLSLTLTLQIAAQHGYVISESLFNQTLGVTDEMTKHIFMQGLGPEFPYELVAAEIYHAYVAHAKAGTTPRKAGMAECIAGLKARGMRLALATSANRALVEIYLQAIPEFNGTFDAVVCGTDIAKSKPEPDIYLLAAEKLGLTPDVCIGVEDSRNGLMSLTAAGIRSVMIPDLLPYDESYAGIVTWVIPSLTELCGLVDGL